MKQQSDLGFFERIYFLVFKPRTFFEEVEGEGLGRALLYALPAYFGITLLVSIIVSVVAAYTIGLDKAVYGGLLAAAIYIIGVPLAAIIMALPNHVLLKLYPFQGETSSGTLKDTFQVYVYAFAYLYLVLSPLLTIVFFVPNVAVWLMILAFAGAIFLQVYLLIVTSKGLSTVHDVSFTHAITSIILTGIVLRIISFLIEKILGG